MPKIETANWTPPPDEHGRRTYAGQRTAREVFDDLEAHLRSIGYLPDEYFLFDCHNNWGNGRLFPEDGWLTCQVDYGGSEGIYLDIALEYYDGGHKSEHFATGKTLDESGAAMDRLHLTASAVTRAFHEDGLHARYVKVGGGAPEPEGITVSLSPEERRVVTDSLTLLQGSLAAMSSDCELAGHLINRIGGGGQEQAPLEIINPHDLYVSPDFQCDATEGFPTSLCWDMNSGKAWLELNDSLAGDGDDVSHCEELCKEFGKRACGDWDDFNAILEGLGEDAVNNAYVYDQGEDMDFGMRGMS